MLHQSVLVFFFPSWAIWLTFAIFISNRRNLSVPFLSITLAQGWPHYGPRAASDPPTGLKTGPPNTLHVLSSTTFPIVDSREAELAAACHVNRTASGPPVARQSRIRLRVKKFGRPCLSCYTNLASLWWYPKKRHSQLHLFFHFHAFTQKILPMMSSFSTSVFLAPLFFVFLNHVDIFYLTEG